MSRLESLHSDLIHLIEEHLPSDKRPKLAGCRGLWEKVASREARDMAYRTKYRRELSDSFPIRHYVPSCERWYKEARQRFTGNLYVDILVCQAFGYEKYLPALLARLPSPKAYDCQNGPLRLALALELASKGGTVLPLLLPLVGTYVRVDDLAEEGRAGIEILAAEARWPLLDALLDLGFRPSKRAVNNAIMKNANVSLIRRMAQLATGATDVSDDILFHTAAVRHIYHAGSEQYGSAVIEILLTAGFRPDDPETVRKIRVFHRQSLEDDRLPFHS